jgi:predicted regulator of Ras-like GTPase activity (Roadblock/LC7/MglB family)
MVMNGRAPSNGQLGWLLDTFARSTPGVVHALVVSGDGLRIAATPSMDVQLMDQLSAATSGLVSLARGTARLLDRSPVTQTIVEMHGGHLFVTPISDRSLLTVVAAEDCDMGMIGYHMTELAAQVGHALTPAARGSDLRAPS